MQLVFEGNCAEGGAAKMATVLNFPRFPKVESENVVTVLKKTKNKI